MFDFVGKKKIFFALSLAVILPGIIAFFVWGLRLGIDFTGGSLLEVKVASEEVESGGIREVVSGVGISEFSVSETSSGNFLIRTKPIKQADVEKIKGALSEKYGETSEERFETIGPTISKELTQNALKALALAILGIIAYITWAFREVPKPASSIRFGLCAIFALVHDVLILVGAFVIFGKFFGAEVDLMFVTAALTVIGFSVHDTIVVFDRIRENLRRNPRGVFGEIVNNSLTQTLGRSLATSVTVIFVLLALILFGGVTIRWFVVALLVGVVSGTYSSIFNASQILVAWQGWIERRRKI